MIAAGVLIDVDDRAGSAGGARSPAPAYDNQPTVVCMSFRGGGGGGRAHRAEGRVLRKARLFAKPKPSRGSDARARQVPLSRVVYTLTPVPVLAVGCTPASSRAGGTADIKEPRRARTAAIRRIRVTATRRWACERLRHDPNRSPWPPVQSVCAKRCGEAACQAIGAKW